MVSYKNWHKSQVIDHGIVRKPIHYKVAEARAIDYLMADVSKDSKVIDIGCANGTGMLHMHTQGFEEVYGIDINVKKVEIAWALGLRADVYDTRDLRSYKEYDIIWCSHAFEHSFNPGHDIKVMKSILSDEGTIFMILPYPDLTENSIAHSASTELGLRIDDLGISVWKWFEKRGLRVVHMRMDSFREPEIWIALVKKGSTQEQDYLERQEDELDED